MAIAGPDFRLPPQGVFRQLSDASRGRFWPAFVGAAQKALTDQSVVTSFWRNDFQNAQAGGKDQSQHLIATALDVVDPNPWMMAERFKAAGFAFVRVGEKHLHAQALEAGVARRIGLL